MLKSLSSGTISLFLPPLLISLHSLRELHRQMSRLSFFLPSRQLLTWLLSSSLNTCPCFAFDFIISFHSMRSKLFSLAFSAMWENYNKNKQGLLPTLFAFIPIIDNKKSFFNWKAWFIPSMHTTLFKELVILL